MSTASWRTSFAFVATALVALAVIVAGCGGGSSYGGSASTARPASSPSGARTSVKLASTKLGKVVLADAQGRTLYLFEADKGAMSNCSGACASIWPPVATSGKPAAGAGIDPAKLGQTKRPDGTSEVTYNRHPLYTYAGDSAPGQTNGQAIDDFGAEWYALSAAGNKIGEDN